MGTLGEMDDTASLGSPLQTTNQQEVDELQNNLTKLEEENDALKVTCTRLQHQLDEMEANKIARSSHTTEKKEASIPGDTCNQCEILTKEIITTKKDHQELNQLRELLEGQVKSLQSQVDEFCTQENILRDEIKGLKESTEVDGLKTSQAEMGSQTNTILTVISTGDQLELQTNSSVDKQISASEFDPCHDKLKELERENERLKEQLQAAEIEKTTLRTNIRKVSANWFERKTRFSDSESENSQIGESEALHSHQDIDNQVEKAVQIPEPAVLEKFSYIFKKAEDIPRLLAEVSFATGKLDLTERMCCELRRRVRDYEKVIDDQEVIIHGMKDQLDTYFTDNQKMSTQLSDLSKLFEELELTEKTQVNSVNPPDTSSCSFPSLPSETEFKEMSGSVSKTYIKLKELIVEKKSLVTEIERLNVLNVELQRRVSQQEMRLVNVSDALHSTWLLVSDMKEQHARLHSSESILRYELKEKRELLHRLRNELECSREQWHKIRQMNSQSEEEWNTLREELNERRRMASELTTSESMEQAQAKSLEGAKPTEEFEPPVDLLLDMAIEYGVIDADDDTSTTMVAAMEGQDLHASRLEDLEDQCSFLYQKLIASTARSLTLASRLSALHHHFGSSDDEYDDEDEDDYNEEEDENAFNEENEEQIDEDHDHLPQLQSEILSLDTESSDTAYMSEAETGSAASGTAGNLSEEEITEELILPSEESIDVDGDLSKRLINFLPKKIEILHRENKRLEERYELLYHEKQTTETQLNQALNGERQFRRQLEEKLEHLGKCVDELKLERNGKIIEAEECLKQKVESLSQREQEYENLQNEIEKLQEKYEERGQLLHLANDHGKKLESTLQARDLTIQETTVKLQKSIEQMQDLEGKHNQLNEEYQQIKEELNSLQQQVADLRFQVSSKDIECHAVIQADKEKLEALSTAQMQISQQEVLISTLEKQIALEKERFIKEQEQLSVQVNQLTQNLEEQQGLNKCLESQLLQIKIDLDKAQQNSSETLKKVNSTKEEASQLTQDNEQLREKIIQLLHRRVRVCDDCFSIQAELATIIASSVPSTVSVNQSDEETIQDSSHFTSTTSSLPATLAQPDDEDFSFISEDELQSSKMSSSSSNGSPPRSSEFTDKRATLNILTLDALTSSPPTDAEVWVAAGSRVLVPVDIPAGISLHWSFFSVPKSVSFAVLHQPPFEQEGREETGPSGCQQRELIPATRVASSEGSTIKGKLLTKQPGVYTLVFDNTCSRFTAKKIIYSLYLEKKVPDRSPSSNLTPAAVS